MNNTITYRKIILIGCIVSILLGVFLHFAYDLSKQNTLVGILAPVNESVWEHLKLIFIPFTIFGIAFYFYSKKKFSNILLVTLFGNVVAMFVVVTLSTLGTMLFGSDNMVYNIISYILSMIVAFAIFYLGVYNIEFLEDTKDSNALGVCALTLMFAIFALSTFSPVKLGITQDPITKTYGIHKHV